MEEPPQIWNLLQLPELVIENIITFIPHRWNVSCTCKMLYKIVCKMEKFKNFIKIEGSKAWDSSIVSQLQQIQLHIFFNYFSAATNNRRRFHIQFRHENMAIIQRNQGAPRTLGVFFLKS